MWTEALQRSRVKGEISNSRSLDRCGHKKLVSFPGIIFNYTQPAEDAGTRRSPD